jgi:hypothetical protein
MAAADTVCFLGFGFHPINMERLRLAAQPPQRGKRWFGTAMGLSTPERERVLKGFGEIRVLSSQDRTR